MRAPARVLATTRGELALGGRMWLMGIVNATPDSFSDTGLERSLEIAWRSRGRSSMRVQT